MRSSIYKRSFYFFLLLCLTSFGFAFDDEPDELNWDRLGGTLTGFQHFCDYIAQHPEFEKALLAQKAQNAFGRTTNLSKQLTTIWVTPEAMTQNKGNQWKLEQVQKRSVITYQPGHGTGFCRTRLTVPKSGYYRIWSEYYHVQGTVASFILRLEDPAVATLDNMFQTVVQDVFFWKFDFAEFGRRTNLLPNRKNEPTGFLWEASPLIWLNAGDRTLTLTGTIHDGPYAFRRIASIVLTEEPLKVPQQPKGTSPIRVGENVPDSDTLKIAPFWERRPVLEEMNPKLLTLWKIWRKAFMTDLADEKISTIEGRRMASLVAFDEEANLIGTPSQIRDEKARMAHFIKTFPRDSFIKKIEGEDFQSVHKGWWIDGHSDASGGRMLVASYGDGLCESEYTIDLPRSGDWYLWSRYLELPGYLSEFRLRITGKDSKTEEIFFCNDEAENKKSPGFRWKKIKVSLPAGPCRLSLVKERGPGLTYRRFDCLVLSETPDWTPDQQAEIIAPFDSKEPLTLWRATDPWQGFSRLSAPSSKENLAPLDVELPQGSIKTFLVLLRNGTGSSVTVQPKIEGDSAQLLSWRVPAFVLSTRFGWQPMPLLERSSLSIPPWETAGIWLTLDGRAKSKNETISLRINDKVQIINVTRKGDLNLAPVPYVGGWSAPYETVSCWETFNRLGLNVVNGLIIPSQQAKKYGIRLFLRLNDSKISQEHINQVVKYFQEYEIPYDHWAWSFMDEPGNKASDQWVELAEKFRSCNKSIQIWCNPGEIESASPESNMKMLPYVNCYCPYNNHYSTKGRGNRSYFQELCGQGRNYSIRLTYTTPCGSEKSPGAPRDMFGPAQVSQEYLLDGWMFYALLGRYEYCNSVWDEVNMFHRDQSVNLYPGAAFRTLSTRNAEAIHAAVDQWRTERMSKQSKLSEL